MFLNKGINVLSLFDGKSSGRTACDLAGIGVNKYYSAEVDKYAIQVSNAIHPEQVRLGDVTKWREWDIDWASIDLLLGGFPCQAWSMAGKQQGDKDERGMLFWVMLDIFKHVQQLNPSVKFLIENVKMKKEFEEYITHHTEQALGHVEKHLINSALVSAQNRQRYYWCNWSVEQPEDLGVMLIDILEHDESTYTYMSEKFVQRNKDAGCLRDDLSGKAKNLSALEYVKNGRQGDYIKCGSMVGRRINPETGKRDDYNKDITPVQQIELRSDDKTGTLTTVQKDNLIVSIEQKPRGFNKGGEKGLDGKTPTLSSNSWEHNNHIKIRDKSKTVRASGLNSYDNHEWDSISDCHYRKFTPRECFRLQTVPEHLIDKILSCGVSNTQLYKIAGNGWTDKVIAHILAYSGLCYANS